jgi:hypothetical protein
METMDWNIELREFLGRYCDVEYWDKQRKERVFLNRAKVLYLDNEFILVKFFREKSDKEHFVVEAGQWHVGNNKTYEIFETDKKDAVHEIRRVFINSINSIKHSTVFAEPE